MRHLYTIPFPEEMTSVRSGDESGAQQQLAQNGILGTRGGQAVEQIALDGSDLHVQGVWKFGETLTKKIASDLESLSESNFGAVPFWSDRESEHDGYYEIETEDVSAHPASESMQRFDIVLSKIGTHGGHYRTVGTNPDDSPGNPFSSGSDPLIGIDAKATKVRWWTLADGAEPAQRSDTVASQYGEVALFDPADSNFDDPQLVYALPFDREGPVDVTVWDDRNSPKFIDWPDRTASHVGDGSEVGDGTTVSASNRTTQWEHVYGPDWERIGNLIVENGRLRVAFDEARGILTAERWANDAWQPESISHADHLLYDATLNEIDPSSVTVEVVFEDTSDGSLDHLNMTLQRGYDSALWLRPANTGSTPSTLTDMLTDIASTDSTDLQTNTSLVPRSEVSE